MWHKPQDMERACHEMRTTTSSFGPFDVISLREIVEHINDYEDAEMIYVKSDRRILPETDRKSVV